MTEAEKKVEETAKAPEVEKKEEPKKEEKKAAAPVAKVTSGKNNRPKACAQCSKNLKKKTWYYRNGKHFCNKGCWKTSTKPKAPKAA